MSTRTNLTRLGLAASLLAFAGCSSEARAPDRVVDAAAPAAGSSGATTTPEPEPDDPLAGTYVTGKVSLATMAKTAHAAGFKASDIREYFSSNFGEAKSVVYTLKLVDGWWVVFNAIDGGSAEEAWSGPYHVVDGSTVEAGAPPCGPITYGFGLVGDQLTLDLQKDDCPGPGGEVPPGELIAQTTIYETTTFQRVS